MRSNAKLEVLRSPAAPPRYRALYLSQSAGFDGFVAAHEQRNPQTWAGLLRIYFDAGQASGKPRLSTLSGNYYWSLVGRRSKTGDGHAFLIWMEEHGITPAAFDQTALNRFQLDLKANHVSKATMGNYMRPINAFLGWCRRQSYIQNPARLLNVYGREFRKGQRNIQPLSDREVQALLRQCWDHNRERDYLLIALVAMTGMRAGEVETITMDSLRRDGKGVWRLSISDGKTDAREIDLPSVAPLPGGEILGQQLKGFIESLPVATDGAVTEGSIFRNWYAPYGVLTVRRINEIVHQAKHEAERLGKVSFRGPVSTQVLRHSYITRQLKAGQTLEQISRYVGNSKVIAWDFYARFLPVDNQDERQRSFRNWGQT